MSRWAQAADKPRALLTALFVGLVLMMGLLHFKATDAGRPYESWDEIATFNSSYVLSGPTKDRAYRYGTLDTAMQWAGIAAYGRFDAIGKNSSHIRYGNIAPDSWSDPLIAFRDKNWEGADYNYFRGNDDRQPIFLSRQIHFIVTYLTLLLLGVGAIFALNGKAIFVLPPLLLFAVAPETASQAALSLPNAINGFLMFGAVLFAMLYAWRRQRSDLVISVSLVALGFNVKPDIIIAIGAPGLALCIVCLQNQWRAALRDAAIAGLAAFAIVLATDPGLLTDPVMTMRIKYHTLMGAAGGGRTGFIQENWLNFRSFLGSVFLGRGAGIIATFGVAAVMTAIPCAALWKRSRDAIVPLIGWAVAVVAWGVIVLRAPAASDRYFINGLAAFLAMGAMALVLLAGRAGAGRRLAWGAAALLALVFVIRGADLGQHSLEIARSYAATDGFDPAHQRTLASLDAIKLAQAPGFHGKVLVDQHSYIDLRPFRLHGIDAQYVNMDNLAGVMTSLDRSRDHLVVFARGTDAIQGNSWRPWMGDWPAQTRSRYQAYQAQLAALSVRKHYSGTPHEVLSTAPIEPNNEMFVSVVARR